MLALRVATVPMVQARRLGDAGGAEGWKRLVAPVHSAPLSVPLPTQMRRGLHGGDGDWCLLCFIGDLEAT